jgi:hypothetical protein
MEVKMIVRRFFFSFIFAILIIALIAGAGFALYRAGMSAGYLAAQSTLVSPNGAAPNTPVVPIPPGWYYGPGYPFLSPFHPLLGFFGFLIIIAFILFPIFGFIRFFAFRGMMHRMAAAGWGSTEKGKWSGHFDPWMKHGPWSQGPEPKPEGENKGPDQKIV